uniref:ACB domain-containing protein n=1 Tax=Strombidium rassoulzadegani TaxID=1082188 RepID=A0A7S3CTR9_9SPIT
MLNLRSLVNPSQSLIYVPDCGPFYFDDCYVVYRDHTNLMNLDNTGNNFSGLKKISRIGNYNDMGISRDQLGKQKQVIPSNEGVPAYIPSNAVLSFVGGDSSPPSEPISKAASIPMDEWLALHEKSKGVVMELLAEKFNKAHDMADEIIGDDINNKHFKDLADVDYFTLWALYQQATVGDIKKGRPNRITMIWKDTRKWDAWSALKGTTKEMAMRKYIALVEDLLDIKFK